MKIAVLISAFAFSSLNSASAAELRGISVAEIRNSSIEVPAPVSAAYASQLLPLNARNILPAALPENPLIVVHASRFFDEKAIAASGINAVVAQFKAQQRPVIYLLNDQSARGYSDWYPGDRAPDYEMFSAGGEHNLPMSGDEVTIAGGFFGSYDGSRGCQTLAARDAIRMHFEVSDRPFTVYMPLRAIYFYEEDITMRKKLLELSPKSSSPAAVQKVFDNFAESFFLTDTFPTSTEDAMGFGHPFTEQELNPAYRKGEPVDTARYSFELVFNDIQVSKFGEGPRKVSIKLYNGK
ncbi:MAG TPA: hypothetical protein DCL44_02870 [Elusimicrobia bacterium]|nr:hypothetical protein [Elusimicrobiota bacterium]